jgi:cell fate regulator YaaT (PSP1 superfamily)
MNNAEEPNVRSPSAYEIVNVRFADLPNTYPYNRNHLNLKNGDLVVAETDRGDGVGTVVIEAVETGCRTCADSLKKVLRKATPKDLEREKERRELEKKAHQLCVEKAGEFRLDMNLVTVQYFFDRSKAVFYFTADGRIDFRELVKNLARSLNTRIEMRQIGVRDKARLVGGIGCCGRELCCQSFLKDFEPVSVRMAKDQNLPLNPSKISGVCGRLMCCLTFEHAIYKKMSRALPKCGKKVLVGSERGKVTRQNPLEGTVVVELEGGKEVEVGPHEIKSEPTDPAGVS